jgi:anti-sigma B factor antagonist
MAAIVAHPLSRLHGAPPEFRCEVRPARRCAYVQPVGELDMVSVPHVDAMMSQLHGDGFDELVVDLRGVTFMDCSGVHLVLRWLSACPSLRIVPAGANVQRLFALTRTDDMLRLVEHPEVDAASDPPAAPNPG